jgi:hypothetical protein
MGTEDDNKVITGDDNIVLLLFIGNINQEIHEKFVFLTISYFELL